MKLLLVDGHNYLFRAYYGTPEDERALPINAHQAVYGFFAALRRCLKEVEPTHLAVVFDSGTGTVRKQQQFPQYKAQRPKRERSVFDQLAVIRRVLVEMGVYSTEHPDYEADDIIGSIAAQCGERGFEVVISSSDNDFMQLVTETCSVLREVRGQFKAYTPQCVLDRFGVHPHQYLDFLAIKGDTSDNIVGVPGIGPKGAASLLAEFGSLEGVLENIAFIPESRARKLESVAESIATVRDFLYIQRDVSVLPEDSRAFEYSPDTVFTPTIHYLSSL